MGLFGNREEVNLFDEQGFDIFDLKSVKIVVRIDNNFIKIARKATLSNTILQGLDGEKTIDLHQVTGYQIKEPGMTRGYLQIIFPGSQDNKGGVFDAVKDENTIIFDKKDKEIIKEIKNRLDKAILSKYK